MPLLTLANADLAYGDLPILDHASFALEERERSGLIGRNGTAKSSLLGILAGSISLDDGELRKKDGLRIVLVPQEPTFPINPPAAAHKLEEFFHRLGVSPDLDPAKASGGEAKRAALAAAFAQEPDVLLLDEPTNHLDIDGILALEALLARQPASIFVTHDRAFLDRVATRILELDRGRLLSFAGKTTLLRIILGTLAPDSGLVRLGANLQPAYFDQLRAALDPEATVADTISPGSEWVEVASGRKHIMSYLGDFLFPPRRANSRVAMLSGGERNRLLLARLFARPANVLVLDEPTNDLDIESLELLEAARQDYSGTLLLVPHDRAFLDNVVTQTLASEVSGLWKEYAGGYTDYVRQRPAISTAPLTRGERPPPTRGERGVGSQKLSYKETRELESLPGEIEALEAEQKVLFARMHEPEYYRQPPDALRADRERTAEIERLIDEKLARWDSLEKKAKAATSGSGSSAP